MTKEVINIKKVLSTINAWVDQVADDAVARVATGNRWKLRVALVALLGVHFVFSPITNGAVLLDFFGPQSDSVIWTAWMSILFLPFAWWGIHVTRHAGWHLLNR